MFNELLAILTGILIMTIVIDVMINKLTWGTIFRIFLVVWNLSLIIS